MTYMKQYVDGKFPMLNKIFKNKKSYFVAMHRHMEKSKFTLTVLILFSDA